MANDVEPLLWLASQEGLSLKPYLDPDGKQWNIGFGHFVSRKRPDIKKISVQDAWRLLKEDWEASLAATRRALDRVGLDKRNPATEKALALLAFNTGPGIYNSKNFRQAAKKGELPLLKWARSVNTIHGEPDKTLTRRRNAEYDWAIDPQSNPLPIRDEILKRFKPFAMAMPTPKPTPVTEEVAGESPSTRETPMPEEAENESENESGGIPSFSDALSRYKDRRAESGRGEWPEWVPDWVISAREKYREFFDDDEKEPLTLDLGEDATPTPGPSPTPSPSSTPSPSPTSTPSPSPQAATTPAPEEQEQEQEQELVDVGMAEEESPPLPPDTDALGRRWLKELRQRAERSGARSEKLRRQLLRRSGIID